MMMMMMMIIIIIIIIYAVAKFVEVLHHKSLDRMFSLK